MVTQGLSKYTVELASSTAKRLKQISLDTDTPIKVLLTYYVEYTVSKGTEFALKLIKDIAGGKKL